MSEVAGKIATQAGAFMLERPLGGRGLLLGGVAGVAAGKVLVIGGGVSGTQAAHVAIGIGAEVYVADRNIDRLRQLDAELAGRASTVFASTLAIEQLLPEMDLVIGAVLVRGAKAPRVVTRAQLALMKRNAVLVDISIDQGGCFETSRPTTHAIPPAGRGSAPRWQRNIPSLPGHSSIACARSAPRCPMRVSTRRGPARVGDAATSPSFTSSRSPTAGRRPMPGRSAPTVPPPS